MILYMRNPAEAGILVVQTSGLVLHSVAVFGIEALLREGVQQFRDGFADTDLYQLSEGQHSAALRPHHCKALRFSHCAIASNRMASSI